MKKIVLFLFMATLAVLAVGCVKKGDSKVSETQKKEDKLFDEIEAMFYADSPEGHSIMEKGDKLYCVDAEGYVTFELPEKEVNVTKVCNGVFLSWDGKEARLRKTDGSEVKIEGGKENLDLLFLIGKEQYKYNCDSQLSKVDDYEYEMANDLFEDGYIIVLKTVSSYAGSSFELGFLKTDGTWAVPLSADNAFLQNVFCWGGDWNIDDDEKWDEVSYCGEGMFSILKPNNYDYHSQCFLYSVKNNSWNSSEITPNKGFVNGVSIAEGVEDNHLVTHVIFENGTSIKMPQFLVGDNAIFSFDKATNCAIALVEIDGTLCVIDSNGKKIKEIGGTVVERYVHLMSETIDVYFENESGEIYYATIDKTGEFVVQPMLVGNAEDSEEGSFPAVIKKGTTSPWRDEYEKVFVINEKGEEIFKTKKRGYVWRYNNDILFFDGEYHDLREK